MTPAETLRAAADRLDEVAAKASKKVCPDWTYGAVRHVARNCEIGCEHYDPYGSDPEPDDGLDHGGWSRYDDAPWISLMDAKVAAPLSAWLRTSAADAELRTAAGQHPEQYALIDAALDFARTVLGQTAPSPAGETQ